MFRITITDLRSSQSETFSADIVKAKAVKDMLRLKPGNNKSTKSNGSQYLKPDPEEFKKVARRDISGAEVIEDVKTIEYIDGQRLMRLSPDDLFTESSKGVHKQEDGSCILILRLDPASHQGRGARTIRLVPKA